MNFTLRDIILNWKAPNDKLYLIEDGCSSISGFEEHSASFVKELAESDVKILNFDQLNVLYS